MNGFSTCMAIKSPWSELVWWCVFFEISAMCIDFECFVSCDWRWNDVQNYWFVGF